MELENLIEKIILTYLSLCYQVLFKIVYCSDTNFNFIMFVACVSSFVFAWFVFTIWMDHAFLADLYWMFVICQWMPYFLDIFWYYTEYSKIPMFIYCYIIYWEPINPYIEWLVLYLEKKVGERNPFFLFTFEEENFEIDTVLIPILKDYENYVCAFLLTQHKEEVDSYNYYKMFFPANHPVITKYERRIAILQDEMRRQFEFINQFEEFIQTFKARKKPVHALKIWGAEDQILRQHIRCWKTLERCSVWRLITPAPWWQFWKL